MRKVDVVETVVTGATTFAWYALPDVVPSRRARALTKIGLMAALGAQGVAQTRRLMTQQTAVDTGAESDDSLAGVRALSSTDPALDASAAGPDGRRRPSAAVVAAGVALVVTSVAGSLAAERGIHHYGQRLATRGVRYPHTRIGLVSGALAAGLTAATARLGEDGPTA